MFNNQTLMYALVVAAVLAVVYFFYMRDGITEYMNMIPVVPAVQGADWSDLKYNKHVTNAKDVKNDVPSSDELLSQDLLPTKNGLSEEEWVKKFNNADNMIIQENMISGNHEAFMTNELPSAKKGFMNLDLRKNPVVPVIPNITPFNNFVAHPSVFSHMQYRPSLDCEND